MLHSLIDSIIATRLKKILNVSENQTLCGTVVCLIGRQHWPRIKCAFTHTGENVCHKQQFPLFCSVRWCRTQGPAQDVLLSASQIAWLQISSCCYKSWVFWLAAVGRFLLLALFLESLGRSIMRNTASCKSEKLNQDLQANAYYEMLHNAGSELAFTVLHCRKRQSWSKKQLSFTMDANSTRLWYCEVLSKN